MEKKLQPWSFKPIGFKVRARRKPPTAPTKTEQKYYKEWVKKVYHKGSALVLGATPELLDIALEHGFITYAVDLSQKTIDLCNNIMKHKNHPNYIMQKGNWLSMKFKGNFFPMILGDAPFINLATKRDNERLFDIIKKIIMPNGYLIIRHIVLPEVKPIPIKELVSLYRQGKITFWDFLMELREVTYLDKLYNKETYQYDAKKNFDLIEEDYTKGIFTKEERDKLMAYRNDIINTFYPEKEFLKLAEKHGFKLLEIFNDNEFRFQTYIKMYVFQKK